MRINNQLSSNENYKIIPVKHRIGFYKASHKLFTPRTEDSKNVLLYLRYPSLRYGREFHPEDYIKYIVPFRVALGLRKKDGYDVALTFKPEVNYAENADIIILGDFNGNVKFISQLFARYRDGSRVFVDNFKELGVTKNLETFVSDIDKKIICLKKNAQLEI